MTTIKITELANIGPDLASSTVVPVVNMAGTPTTQKTNVGSIANLILEGAGVDYPEASVALLAQTVSNAAQPNITSVGTLTSLEITNDLTASGTAYLGNISSTGVASVTTLVVGSTSDLGAVNNIIIEGGTNGQVLTTDGDGNLSWTTVSGGGGNGTPGGSNTQVQFNDAGSFGGEGNFTYDSGNHVLSVTRANTSYLTVYESIVANALTVEQNIRGNGALNLQGIENGNTTINIGSGVGGDIDMVSNLGNINLYTANNQPWIFDQGGNLTAPGAINVGNMVIGTVPGDITADANTGVTFNVSGPDGGFAVNYLDEVGNANTSGGELAFSSETGNATYRISLSDDLGDGFATKIWRFDGTGNITLPGGNVTIGSVLGGDAILANNIPFGVVSQGNSGATVVQWSDDISNTSLLSAVYVNGPFGNVGDIQVRTGDVGTPNVWTFGNNGNLTLPGNTFSVNYANGTPVSIGGGGGNTGNVTFDNVTVQGVNGLNLSAGADFTANLAYLQVRAGDVASHIHLDTGNNSAYDLIVGDDQNYVQVSSTGNILLSAYDSNTSQYTWTLDYNGNLILAGGNSVIQSIANSSLDILNPNVSTMVLTPDPGYSSQALVLDPTSVGHIHLRSPGSNIDQPSANIFLGGETSSFEVGQYNGAVPNLFIHSNNYTWTFDIDGNLTLPGNTFAVNYANGNQVSIGGGGGAAISNGTSYANVVSSDGNVVIGVNNDNMTWTFATDRKIYGLLDEDVQLVAVDDGAGIGVRQVVVDNSLTELSRTRLEETDFFIQFDLDTSANSWRFDSGSLRPPTNGAFEQFDGNIKMYAMDAGSNPVASLQSVSNQNDPNIFSTFDATTSGANISVYNGGSNGGVGYTWRFANDGKLTFPGTPRIDTATNNFEVQAAEAINFEANTVVNIYTDAGNTTYQWQFGDDGNLIIPGTGGGFIKTISNASIGIAAMDNGTNNPAQLLSINAGSGAATSIVSAYSTNATIQTNATGTLNTWQFDNAGNLTLPTGGQIIVSGGLVSSGASPAPTINGFSITNSVGISGNGNIAGGNISATGNVSGNFFLGNGSQLTGITVTSLVNGTSNVVVASSGNVTVGVAGSANVITATSTGANVTGTLNATGDVTAQGTGSNIVRRAFGLVAADTYVQLDDLKARVTSSTSQLSLILDSGTWQGTGWTETFAGGGTPSVNNWVNLPLSSGFDNASGAMPSQGNGCRCIISDQTPSAKVYQITVVRSGTTGSQWNISIERLV